MKHPEEFWIDLGSNIIGRDVIREKEDARQYPTYRALLDWIAAHNPATILDVGCNYAPLGVFLAQVGYPGRYCGVDSNLYALMHARRLGVEVHFGNLRHLDYVSHAVDAVIVKDVIEHLESYTLLAEAFRVAAQWVVVSTFLVWSDAPQVIVRDPNGYYMNRYNRADVYALAHTQGFEVRETIAVWEQNGAANEIVVFRRVN